MISKIKSRASLYGISESEGHRRKFQAATDLMEAHIKSECDATASVKYLTKWYFTKKVTEWWLEEVGEAVNSSTQSTALHKFIEVFEPVDATVFEWHPNHQNFNRDAVEVYAIHEEAIHEIYREICENLDKEVYDTRMQNGDLRQKKRTMLLICVYNEIRRVLDATGILWDLHWSDDDYYAEDEREVYTGKYHSAEDRAPKQ
jgi:Cdc6-like AAA superfamily ATPase